MKKKIVSLLCFGLFIVAVLVINPYNLYHHIKAERTVSALFAEPTVREEAFGNNLEISNIEYLGSNMYRIETSANIFVIEIKSEGSHINYKIYEYKKKIETFGD